jgi:hypothetical protein
MCHCKRSNEIHVKICECSVKILDRKGNALSLSISLQLTSIACLFDVDLKKNSN